MLVPLVCALIYLVLCTRVLTDVSLELSSTRQRARALLRVGGLSFCIDRALALRDKGASIKEKAQRFQRVRQFAWLFRAEMGVLRWGVVQIRMRIGTGDAAVTAVAAGMLHTLITAALGLAGVAGVSDVSVFPDFAKPCAVLRARCIFSFSLGDIMFAAVRAAVKKMQREGFKWLSIPLKA